MLVLQYDDRSTDQYSELLKQTEFYAKTNGLAYLMARKGYENIPPWWRKVFLAREMLPLYEGVLWVDSDATIVSTKTPEFLLGTKHFAFSPNPPMLDSESLSMFSAPFCAGNWVVKNSPEGRAIMDAWARCYDESLWTKIGGVWKGKGPYAGPAYEQGAFEIYVVRRSDFKPWIASLSSRILNYMPMDDHKLRGISCPADVFAIHYWCGNRSHIHKHWKSGAR